jgi:NTE family protein
MKRILLFALTILIWFSGTALLKAQEPKVGICLSGGGALGFAHLGVLQALEEKGFRFDIVAGTSMGAVVGSMYAAGYTPAQLMEITMKEKMYKKSKLLNLMPKRHKTGLSDHKALKNIILKYIPSDNFDSLKKRLFVCVTNLDSAKAEYVGHGPRLSDYVIASASIPGVFESVVIDSAHYVDGGVLNNVPAQPIRKLCDVIIGSDVDPYELRPEIRGLTDVLKNTVKLVVTHNASEGRLMCNFLITIRVDKKLNSFSFKKYREIYLNGYRTAIAYIEAHREMMQYACVKNEAEPSVGGTEQSAVSK